MKTLSDYKFFTIDEKIEYSTEIIKDFYDSCEGKVYISFSGGRDSTILLHLVRSIYPDVPAAFFNTGLEFPEIVDFVKTKDNVDIRHTRSSFIDVVNKFGYPVGGKNLSHWIALAQSGAPSGIRQMNATTKYGHKKFKWMVDAPFKISDRCCAKLKREPAQDYFLETGRGPLVGTRAGESDIREERWARYGETYIQGEIPVCTPLSIWSNKDIQNYIDKFELEISEIYNMGYNRTGCALCMYGIFGDRNRFLRLKHSHPEMWEFAVKPLEEGGAGIGKVLDFIGVPSGLEQSSLMDFNEPISSEKKENLEKTLKHHKEALRLLSLPQREK